MSEGEGCEAQAGGRAVLLSVPYIPGEWRRFHSLSQSGISLYGTSKQLLQLSSSACLAISLYIYCHWLTHLSRTDGRLD